MLHDQKARLSGAALETLAIVAYKQPISRAQVASIRGVDPDGVIRTLQARGYIDEVGRDDGPGQAVLFGTTPAVPREARASTRSTTCRRSPSSSPTPTSSRRSNAACVPNRRTSPTTWATTARWPEMAPQPPDERRPEPPLWEQWAEQRAHLPQGERLQKVLASTGWGSRRACEELIADGRVTVNGDVAELGRRVDPEVDEIEVDGAPVGVKPGLVYYLLNKPRGTVTTAKDTHGRPTVVELVPSEPRVFSGGAARRRHRGAAAAHQRRRTGAPHQPSQPRGREGVPRARARARVSRGLCAGSVTASSSTTA